MKYEKPNMFVIYTDNENLITASIPGTLLPGTDIGDGNVEIEDD